MIYALSTCVWCKKTKQFLKDLGIEYDYVDVDLLSDEEKEEAEEQIIRWNPSVSFPTVVIDNSSCLVGFQPDKLSERFK